MSRAYRSALIVGLSQPVTFVGQLAINILLARYLAPKDIGLVAMVTTIINFASIFRELGLGTVTMQREEITDQQASNLFWLNVAFGLSVSLVVCALALPISRLYRDPRVAAITAVTSAVFLVTGLSVQHSALLRRDMRFGLVTIVNVASLFISGAAGVLYAIISRSYWAIVLFIVGRQVLVMFGLWLVSGWKPATFKRGHGTKDLVQSGLHVAGFDVINYWSRNLDHLLIGRFLGAGVLGLYRKAYEMLLLPLTQMRAPLTAVSLPALSKFQSTPTKLSAVFLDLVSTTALLSAAIVALMLLVVDWLVPVILGRQWAPVIPLFSRLAPVAVMQSVVGLLGLLLITTGNTRRYLQWGAWHAATLVSAFILGIRWGLIGLINCYIGATILLFVPSVLFCTKPTAVSPYRFIERTLVPNLYCWVAFAGASLVKSKLIASGIGLGTASLAGTAIFAAVTLAHVLASKRRYSLLVSVFHRSFLRRRAAQVTPAGSFAAEPLALGDQDSV